MQKDKTLLQTIKSNPLAWIVQGLGLLVLILNLWTRNKLYDFTSIASVVITKI